MHRQNHAWISFNRFLKDNCEAEEMELGEKYFRYK